MAYTDDWESLMNGVFGPGGKLKFSQSTPQAAQPKPEKPEKTQDSPLPDWNAALLAQQKKLDEMEAGNLTELEKANKALETANQQIADMQKKNAIRDQREALMEKLKINAEQAKTVVKDDGSIDYDALGKITSEKETAAAQAKEQEIANNSENPGGGTAGGENKKTADVENAESISFGEPAKNAEAKDHYVL